MKPETLQELRGEIQNACRNIQVETIQNVCEGSSQKYVLNRSNVKPLPSVDKMFNKQLNRSIFIKTVLLSLPIVHYIFHNSHTVLIPF